MLDSCDTLSEVRWIAQVVDHLGCPTAVASDDGSIIWVSDRSKEMFNSMPDRLGDIFVNPPKRELTQQHARGEPSTFGSDVSLLFGSKRVADWWIVSFINADAIKDLPFRKSFRDRVVKTIHDEVLPGFCSVRAWAGLIENEETREGVLEAARDGEQAARQLMETERLMPGKNPAEEIIYITETIELTGAEVNTHVEDGFFDQISPSEKKPLVLAVHEALRNAANHCEEPTIDLVLSFDSDGWQLEVSDDGPGFDWSSVCLSGLESIQKRAGELGGEISISTGNDGTTITIQT